MFFDADYLFLTGKVVRVYKDGYYELAVEGKVDYDNNKHPVDSSHTVFVHRSVQRVDGGFDFAAHQAIVGNSAKVDRPTTREEVRALELTGTGAVETMTQGLVADSVSKALGILKMKMLQSRQEEGGISSKEDRPLAAMLFNRAPGAGKLLSDYLYNSNLIKLDMREYSEAHTVLKLLGAPPGYLGFNDGGLLTGRCGSNPMQWSCLIT